MFDSPVAPLKLILGNQEFLIKNMDSSVEVDGLLSLVLEEQVGYKYELQCFKGVWCSYCPFLQKINHCFHYASFYDLIVGCKELLLVRVNEKAIGVGNGANFLHFVYLSKFSNDETQFRERRGLAYFVVK
jgi:hypothetical protein